MSLWAGIQAAQVELAGIKRPMVGAIRIKTHTSNLAWITFSWRRPISLSLNLSICSSLYDTKDRLKRAVEIGRIILDELSGAVLMIPYGLRAARSYFALPPMQRLLERRTGVAGGAYKVEHNARGDVAIVRGVRCAFRTPVSIT